MIQVFLLEEVTSGGVGYTGYRMPFANLYDMLAASARRFPDKTALIDAEREIAFSALQEEVDALSAYLAGALGIGTGSRVGLMMVNSIEFAAAFYAVVKLGATVVSVNTKLSADEVCYILRDSQAGCLITDRRWQEKAAGAGVERVLVTEELAAAMAAGRQMAPVPSATDDSLPAEIMYTSGTTGRPKGAVMTHFNLMQGLYAYAVDNRMDDTESTVLAVPAFHITGLNCVLTLFIFLGGLVVMSPFFDAVDVLDKMTQYKVTHFHAVATVFILLESAMLPRHDLSSLRTALCGGGFISRETVERFCRKAPNCAFHPVYGMTETSGAGTYFPVHCLASPIENSCGRATANCAIRVVDPEGREVPPQVSGEICFKGPFIIREYLHGRGQENITDGWLHSGDIGCFDGEGYLYIKDRIKDMINRGGEKVFSLPVEDAIMAYQGVKQAAVFAVDDPLYGEVPGAVVIPAAGAVVDLEGLRAFLRQHLAHYKVPVYIELRQEMPVTANEKVQKFQLRQEFNQRYAHR